MLNYCKQSSMHSSQMHSHYARPLVIDCFVEAPKVSSVQKHTRRSPVSGRPKFKYAPYHIKYIMNDVLLLNPFNKLSSIAQTWNEITNRFNDRFNVSLSASRIAAMVGIWLKRFTSGEPVTTEGRSRANEIIELNRLLGKVFQLRDEERHFAIPQVPVLPSELRASERSLPLVSTRHLPSPRDTSFSRETLMESNDHQRYSSNSSIFSGNLSCQYSPGVSRISIQDLVN